MRERPTKQKFRRKGFSFGLFAGAALVAYRAFKYPGSISRSDLLPGVVVVLTFGLGGGLMGSLLGALFGSPEGKDD